MIDIFTLSFCQRYKRKEQKEKLSKKTFFSLIKTFLSLIKTFLSLIKTFLSLIKPFLSTTLTPDFIGLHECLKYLNILKFLNSSVREKICLVFRIFIWLEWRKFFLLKKNQKGNEKSEKENC
jgi:hypothetical protein